MNLLGGDDVEALAADLVEENPRQALAPEIDVIGLQRACTAMVVGQRRAALAAYRLADILKTALT